MNKFQLTSLIPNLELSPQQWRTKLINTITFNTGQLGDLVVPSNLTLTILKSWLRLQNNKAWCWGWKCCFPSIAWAAGHIMSRHPNDFGSSYGLSGYITHFSWWLCWKAQRDFPRTGGGCPSRWEKTLGMICSKGQSDRRFMLQNGAQGLLRIDVYRNNMKQYQKDSLL